jgi:hypothetical protein
MFPQRWLPHWSNSLFLLSVFLGGFFCNGSFSQEPSSQDARTRSDKQGRIVGLTYWGQGGLRQSAPKDVSSLTNVDISYGTTLTRDDIEFLASLQNVEELSFGGNLDGEYVAIEGDLSPLGKLKRLESVFLCKRNMHDRDLEFLRELPNLKALEFLAGPMGSITYAHFKSSTLEVNGKNTTGNGVVPVLVNSRYCLKPLLHLKSGFAKMKGESGSLAVSARKGQIEVAWWFLPLNHRNNPCDAKMNRVGMLVAGPPLHHQSLTPPPSPSSPPSRPGEIILSNLGIENGKLRMENY